MVFALSGRVEEQHVLELQTLFDHEAELPNLTIDLKEVQLVDRKAVRFLAVCESDGVKLRNCPPYIREWIETGSDTGYEPQHEANSK